MVSIGKKIRLAFSGKKSEIADIIPFSQVKSYIEGVKNKVKISKNHSYLIKNYEEFIEKLDNVKKELDILKNNGEKKFTKITNERLKGIKKINEFNLSSFKEFYVDAAQVVRNLMKIPARIQRNTLIYENGEETIDAFNIFLKSFRVLNYEFSKIKSEDNTVNIQRNALTKFNEMQEFLVKKESLLKSIKLLKKGKEEKNRILEEKNANIQSGQSKIRNKKALEIKKSISALDRKLREIDSKLKINLLKGRRPISKILYSKDKKLFKFFKSFIKYPIENVNEKFWKMIDTLEKENLNFVKERKKIEAFLKFSRNNLSNMIEEYLEVKLEKKKFEEKLKEISLANKKILLDFELQKEIAQNDFTRTRRKLDEIEKEKNTLEIDIDKNLRILEKLLSKIVNNKVQIDLKNHD